MADHGFLDQESGEVLRISWRDVDPSGAASIEWFDRWVKNGDGALRQRLLNYNEDDCRAMRVVMDGMTTMTVQTPWEPPVVSPCRRVPRCRGSLID